MLPDEVAQAFAEQEKRYAAVGRSVEAAASLDMELRSVLCALLNSKYAAVIIAGRMTRDLLDDIKAIVKVHREMSDDHRAKFLELLAKAKSASERRNRFVHDVWGIGAGGETDLMQSVRRRHEYSIQTVTVEEIEQTARDMQYVAVMLHRAVGEVLGWEAASMEVQLRWEEHLARQTPEQLAEMVERRQKSIARKTEEAGSE